VGGDTVDMGTPRCDSESECTGTDRRRVNGFPEGRWYPQSLTHQGRQGGSQKQVTAGMQSITEVADGHGRKLAAWSFCTRLPECGLGGSGPEARAVTVAATETLSVGIREFRATLAGHIDADPPVTAIRHGQAARLLLSLLRPSSDALQPLLLATSKVLEAMLRSDEALDALGRGP
jgi:hypothetical protein